MPPTLTGLFVYPVKSARGIALDAAQIEARGIPGDRRFMVVDADGRFVTQREEGGLARLVPRYTADGMLELSIAGVGSVVVAAAPEAGEMRDVLIWHDRLQALDAGRDAAALLSAAFGRALSLVYMPDTTDRQVQREYAELGDTVGFADAFPYLLTSESSLRDLNARLHDAAVPMSRFRPNLVISGPEAFEEDTWHTVRIGSVPFEVRKPCTRCVVVTRDQQSGESQGSEPLRTLSRYRTWQNKAIFGQNLLSRGLGLVRLGDPFEVLSEGARKRVE